MMRRLLPAMVCLTVGAAMAQPSVTLKRVQQRYPWNGMVDIDYEISGYGANDDPSDYAVKFALVAESAGGAVAKEAASFVSYAACDLPTGTGVNRVTWDAVADGCDFAAKGAQLKVSLLYERVEPADAVYAIVNLDGGRNASSYPVRYVGDSSVSATEFNRDLYKTTRIVLKKVPAGDFWMGVGSATADPHLGDVSDWDGVSRHRVSISRDFYLGLFPVTIAQYTNVVEFSELFLSQNLPKTPVTRLWWYEAEDISALPFFATLLSKARCRGAVVPGFTLPTESQLEYATRAGTSTGYYNGWSYVANMQTEMYNSGGRAYRNMLREYCFNYHSFPSHKASDWTGDVYPPLGKCSDMGFMEVGFYSPNPWGFYDFFGSGYEWCLDWYGDYPAGTMENPAKNPTGPAAKPAGSGRCFRGSTFEDKGNLISCGLRSPETNKIESNSWRHGFRLALTIPAAE